MTDPPEDPGGLRVLVLAPSRVDGRLTAEILERAHVEAALVADLHALLDELARGAGAVVLPEEWIHGAGRGPLAEWLASQPPWSDLPVLVLARPGADSAAVAQAMDLLGNVTVLERPTRVAAFVSAVRTALRSRRRQYQTRRHLAQRERDERALREADRRKDEFLAILAHELRNPLAPLSNSLSVLRMTTRDPATLRLGEVMARQVAHLVRLVDDLLEVSRITRGKFELRRERVDLASIVHTAVETSRPLVDASRHRFQVSLPDGPLPLHGDPVRLTQVFSNLLNNAAKYTAPGGDLRLDVRADERCATVTVSDSGIGIAAPMLGRIFDLFVQDDASRSHAQGGLGIGLTLVKVIVEMHGGTVEARSRGPGSGSEFVVCLPLATAEGAAAGPSCRPALAAPRRVLVVDDNRDAAESLAILLRSFGSETCVAFDGPSALRALSEFRPDAVLLDIGMPGMDGHEVARRIRARPEFSHVLLVALTGWGQEEDRRRSRLAGFDHHLNKPADMNALVAVLAGGVAASRA